MTTALTARALLWGALIGAIASLANLYVGLKTGLAFNVAVIACLGGVGLDALRERVWRGRGAGKMSVLELSALMSTASAAGYATGATLISVNVAHLLLGGAPLPAWGLFGWTLGLAALGTLFAVPLKRALIDREALPFPTGTAAAATIETYARGTGGRGLARALSASALGAGAITLLRDGLQRLPALLAFPGELRGIRLERLSFGLEPSPLLLGVGALMGLRVTAAMVLGAAVCFLGVGPRWGAWASVQQEGSAAILDWSKWAGASLLVTASLGALWRGRRGARAAPTEAAAPQGAPRLTAADEVPRRWTSVGVALLSGLVVALAWRLFGIPPRFGGVAVGLAFVASAVSARVAGQTDVTPSGPMGQLVQLSLSRFFSHQPGPLMMTAGIAESSAAAAADLLTDFKAGHLLGAKPRQQLVAQLFGCGVGAAVLVPAFHLLVPGAEAIGPHRFPAPAGTVTASVSLLLAGGYASLPPQAQTALLWGAVLGACLTLLEALLPARVQAVFPSPVGLGLALLVPPSMSITLFVGALLGQWLRPERRVAVASGLIAGESLAGIAAAVVQG